MIDPKRSKLMGRVRQRDTAAEVAVRKLLHAMGYRFRLHRNDLPGTPDIVFPSRRKVIFVHGCFWHRHPDCDKATTPITRTDFWLQKFSKNVERDDRKILALQDRGWQSYVVWECQVAVPRELAKRLRQFLGRSPDPKRTHSLPQTRRRPAGRSDRV